MSDFSEISPIGAGNVVSGLKPRESRQQRAQSGQGKKADATPAGAAQTAHETPSPEETHPGVNRYA